METIKIKHGTQKSDYMAIIRPRTPMPEDVKLQVEIHNMETGQKSLHQFIDKWIFRFSEIPDYFTRLIYGVDNEAMKKKLLKRFPELRTEQDPQIEYWLLKRV